MILVMFINIQKFKYITNVIKALKYISNKNCYIFIVTNQAGIGKKKNLKLSDFETLHKKLKKIF